MREGESRRNRGDPGEGGSGEDISIGALLTEEDEEDELSGVVLALQIADARTHAPYTASSSST